MKCSKCGRENNEAYRFCLGCGGDLHEEDEGLPGLGDLPGTGEAPGMGDGAWRPLLEKPGFLTVTMSVRCEHCAQPVPVNGPVRRVHCANCEEDTPLYRLHEELVLASEGYQTLGSPYTHQSYNEAEPQCPRCGEGVPVGGWLRKEGASVTIPCPACGARLPTYPAPEWLKKKLPNARQVFGGDPEVARDEAGLDLQVEADVAGPVVMSCPQCSGSLSIKPETPRTMTCGFCGVSVFLPDALWLRLHPARKMRRWTLSFERALGQKPGDVDPSELERLREKGERSRENREARLQAEAEAGAEAAKPGRAGLFLGLGLGASGLIAAVVVVVMLVGGKGCSWSEGTLTTTGPPLGDLSITPVKCKSGQREGFHGVMLLDDQGKVVIRVVMDPVRGTLVGVQKKDSCRGSQCEYVMFDRRECPRFDVAVENTNTTVNDIRVVEGHLKLDCAFKDTGGTVKADLKFKCD